jgi:hypothetical protein
MLVGGVSGRSGINRDARACVLSGWRTCGYIYNCFLSRLDSEIDLIRAKYSSAIIGLLSAGASSLDIQLANNKSQSYVIFFSDETIY